MPHDSGEAGAPIRDLFQAHYAELCRFAYRCVKSRALAEEVVQDVFLRIWKQQGTAQSGAVTKSYLYRAVRNHALDYLKHQHVEQVWEQRVRLEGDGAEPGPDRELDSAELARAARRAVEQLPERCRLVFTLRREQDLSYEEIADTMGISIKTVENHMGRALRLLTVKLAPYLSVGALVASAGWWHRLVD